MNAQMDRVRLRAGISILTVSVSLSVFVASSHAGDGPMVQFRKVAETGMAAPGAEPGVVFGALTTGIGHTLMVPKLDEAGRVAFMAMLSGPGIDVTNFQGMWAEHEGELQLVARGGLPAPDTEEGVLFIGVPSLDNFPLQAVAVIPNLFPTHVFLLPPHERDSPDSAPHPEPHSLEASA